MFWKIWSCSKEKKENFVVFQSDSLPHVEHECRGRPTSCRKRECLGSLGLKLFQGSREALQGKRGNTLGSHANKNPGVGDVPGADQAALSVRPKKVRQTVGYLRRDLLASPGLCVSSVNFSP